MALRRKKQSAPYWLKSNEVGCADCEVTFAHAVEIRCGWCDAALCVFCVERVDEVWICERCEPAAQKTRRR